MRRAPVLSVFSTAIRVLPCEHCESGVSVPVEGGVVPCPQCGAHLHAPPRPDIRVARDPAIDEAQRLMNMRLSGRRPLLAPPAVAGLFTPRGDIEPGRRGAVRLAWLRVLAYVRTTGGDEDAYAALRYIVNSLSSDARRRGDDRFLRPLHESAVEVLGGSPWRRQIEICTLARLATGEDLESAEQWLSLCDPTSHDLEADTSYRVSCAGVATERRDWHAVLTLLGGRSGDVPIADSFVSMAGVYRANAHERLGDVSAAVEILRLMFRRGPAAKNILSRAPGLCVQAAPLAEEAERAREAAINAPRPRRRPRINRK